MYSIIMRWLVVVQMLPIRFVEVPAWVRRSLILFRAFITNFILRQYREIYLCIYRLDISATI